MGARKSTNLWLIVNPHNSNEVLHDFGGTVMFCNTLQPVGYTVGGKRRHSQPIIYKTSRGALNRSHKQYPEWDRHHTLCMTSLEERSFNGKIWSYKGQWNDEGER